VSYVRFVDLRRCVARFTSEQRGHSHLVGPVALSFAPPNGRNKQRASRTRAAVDPSRRRGVVVRIAVANYLEGFARIANREGLEAHVSSVGCWRSSVDALRPQYCAALEMNLFNIAHRPIANHGRSAVSISSRANGAARAGTRVLVRLTKGRCAGKPGCISNVIYRPPFY
jgi:hypothetical protein